MDGRSIFAVSERYCPAAQAVGDNQVFVRTSERGRFRGRQRCLGKICKSRLVRCFTFSCGTVEVFLCSYYDFLQSEIDFFYSRGDEMFELTACSEERLFKV